MNYKHIAILILLICIIILSCCVGFANNKDGFDEKRAYENYFIVCSKYNKNTDFLSKISIRSDTIDKTMVPNKAHEATTYLYYIIENYDNLPENVIFIHDEDESWHHDGKITDNIYKWIDEYEHGGRKYHNFNASAFHDHANIYKENPAFRDYWDAIFTPTLGDYETAKFGNPNCCAQFIVSRDKIVEKPKEFYKKMYDWLIQNTNGEGNGNKDDMYSGYMTSRYAEYTWKYMFY